MLKTAILSKDREYRYALFRVWDASSGLVAFVGLNPSTADECEDDPTIRRCMGFAKEWGCGGVVMLNLFGYRETHPKRLESIIDPVGRENNEWLILFSSMVDRIILAWGSNGNLYGRDKEVIDLLPPMKLYQMGWTQERHPKHPLYLRKDTKPTPYFSEHPDSPKMIDPNQRNSTTEDHIKEEGEEI